MPYEEEYDHGKYDGEMDEMRHDDFCRKHGIGISRDDEEEDKEEDDE
jgi:hypothetical protein